MEICFRFSICDRGYFQFVKVRKTNELIDFKISAILKDSNNVKKRRKLNFMRLKGALSHPGLPNEPRTEHQYF